MEYANLIQVTGEFANQVIRLAQIEIGATRTRISYRANWKKVGARKWQPYNVQKVRRKRRIDSSGKLRNSHYYMMSISDVQINLEFFSSTSYANYVNDGREPGKGIPIKAMNQWIQSKGLRPRAPGGGGFIKNTQQARNSMGFLMNRKIKYFGIEPTNYFDNAFNKAYEQYQPLIIEAYQQDIIDNMDITL